MGTAFDHSGLAGLARLAGGAKCVITVLPAPQRGVDRIMTWSCAKTGDAQTAMAGQ